MDFFLVQLGWTVCKTLFLVQLLLKKSTNKDGHLSALALGA
jgi:hypothetical protein